jgi:hypothetical protein
MSLPTLEDSRRAFLRHWVWLPLVVLLGGLHFGAWLVAWTFLVRPRATPDCHHFQVLGMPGPKGGPPSWDRAPRSSFQLLQGQHSLLAYGVWKAPRSGLYRYRLTTTGTVRLFLDRQEVRVPQVASPSQSPIKVVVEKGWHLLVIALEQSEAGRLGGVDLEVRGPGETLFQHIQGEALIGLDGADLVRWRPYLGFVEWFSLVGFLVVLACRPLLGGRGYAALLETIRTRYWQAGTVAAFGLFLALPLLQNRYHLFHYPPLNENRSLSPWPKLAWKALFTSGGKEAEKYEGYYNDRYGCRDLLVRLRHQLDYSLFRWSEGVVLGSKGWMEYRDVIECHQVEQERAPDASLASFCANTQKLASHLEARGIHLIVVTCPMKNTVYPEHFQRVPRRPQTTVYNKYCKFLTGLHNITHIDTLPILNELKSIRPVYHKTDFHWNHPAGFAIAREIVNAIGRLERLKGEVWRHELEIEQKEFTPGGLNCSLAVFTPPREISLFVKPNWAEDPDSLEYATDKGWEISLFGKPHSVPGSNLPPPRPFESIYKAGARSKQARLPLTMMVGNSFSDAFQISGCRIYFKTFLRVRTSPGMWKEVLESIPPECRYFILQMIETEIPELFAGLPPLP